MLRRFFYIIIVVVFYNCKTSVKKEEIIPIKDISTNGKEYNFGSINKNDTIIHFFEIGNNSKSDLIIKKIGTSCGCTSIGKIDSIIKPTEKTKLKIRFIPKKKQKGMVSNSVAVEMNTNPAFLIFRLKGNVE